MKNIVILLMISGSMILVSCSSKTAKDQDQEIKGVVQDSQKAAIPKMPTNGAQRTTIQENRSEVLAEFVEKHQKSETDFSINARVLEVKEDPSYPSIAESGNTYELYPNFTLGEQKEIQDTPKNKMLMKLNNLNKGDRFRAIIFLDNGGQWMIQEVIDK